MSSESQVKMSPPHISDMPQQPEPYPQDAQASQNAALAQNYRDQLFAQCAIGNHERKTEYGICGIITAIVCFPCGLICLFMDKKEKCSRCGVSLDNK